MDTHGKPAALLVLAAMLFAPIGCKSEMDKLSEYPFYLTTLNDRMELAAKSLPSDKPNLNLPYTLVSDMDSAVLAMEDTYRGANRDAAIAKLKEIREGLDAQLATVLRKTPNGAVLLPNKKPADVAAVFDKMYEKYKAEFRPLVKGG